MRHGGVFGLWCWASEAKGFAALDQGPHAASAIRLSDAVRLFGVAVPQAAALLSLVPAAAGADEPAPPDMTAHHGPGEIWTDHHRDLLFTIYLLMKRRAFVPCVQVTARCVAWPESRVLQWVQDRIAAADKQGATDGLPAKDGPQ